MSVHVFILIFLFYADIKDLIKMKKYFSIGNQSTLLFSIEVIFSQKDNENKLRWINRVIALNSRYLTSITFNTGHWPRG